MPTAPSQSAPKVHCVYWCSLWQSPIGKASVSSLPTRVQARALLFRLKTILSMYYWMSIICFWDDGQRKAATNHRQGQKRLQMI